MSAPDSNHDGVGVEVRGLKKGFNGQEVLKDLNFKVEPGEIFVLMGPSGSGKSVLLRQIIGLELPDSGEILINGESIQSPDVMEKYRMAMVFQSGALLNSLTVAENVGIYLSEHRLKKPDEIAQIVSKNLEIVGLKGTETKMPSELSGGMKKRVAIARALIVEPQLILYDEPTSELDPISSMVVGEQILKLNQGSEVTSIVVSHDRELAYGIADRIAVIIDGNIVAIGTPDEVKRNPDPELQKFLHAEIKRPTKN